MKRRTLPFILVLLAVALPTANSDTGSKRQTLETVILVEDRFETADEIEQWVEANKGYLVSRLEDRLILRVPSGTLEGFVDYLETVAAEIVQIRQETEDISQSLLEAEAGIRSKNELFQKALLLIDQTDLAATLEIESEILSILTDLEGLKGRHRKLSGEVDLARVQVDFTLREEKLPENLASSFPWINAVDFYLLMQELEQN
ncbi:MAG: DUF4349 domain-containing protein [Spirochaetales bacterium]|nr:DUF4349 domain-containing protein [Spirochaetales bacterium]